MPADPADNAGTHWMMIARTEKRLKESLRQKKKRPKEKH
jgi:hypothetical protein